MSKPPLNLEINGQQRTFEYGKTEVHCYRYAVDQPYNHIEAIEHGSQKIFIFNCLPYCMFLAGQELPGHEFDKKQIKQLTKGMDEAVGWEADFVLKDECPEDIKERYIRIATVALRKEVVTIPAEWSC
jgi:hypothetical protein